MGVKTKIACATVSRPLLAIGAATILLVAMTGCQGGDTDTAGIASADIARVETWTPGGLTPPTLTELDAALDLTAGQQPLMQTALANWQEAIEARRAERQAARQSGEHPGRHGGPGGNGESPLHLFLVESAQLLSPDQFVAMTSLLADLRSERPQRAPLAGLDQRPHMSMRRDGHILNLADELSLTDEQVSALQELFAKDRGERRGARSKAGTTTRPRGERRTAMGDRLKQILTAEQFETWQGLCDQRREEREAERTIRQAASLDRHVTFLTNVLGLDTDQALAVKGILEKARDQRQKLFADTREGALERTELGDALKEIAGAADAAIRELLTPDQIKLYDAVQSLRPTPGRRGGGAPGHGPL